MIERPVAPATERNRDAILDVLRQEFSQCTDVLEIGSGTGQHAVYFAAGLRHLQWQTSDVADNHAGIRSWVAWAELPNVREPLEVDMHCVDDNMGGYDAIFSANTAHIMSFPLVQRMFEFVGRAMVNDGLFCLYGPFTKHGEFSSDSNASFDASLRRQDRSMGIRDLSALMDCANRAGLEFLRQYAMPANNLMLFWRKKVP